MHTVQTANTEIITLDVRKKQRTIAMKTAPRWSAVKRAPTITRAKWAASMVTSQIATTL